MLTSQSTFDAIYNDGERLVPGESHDVDEVIRHKSSYEFFCRIIKSDILNNPLILSRELRILDIGSGTGHGTFMLSNLPGVQVTGLEPGVETTEYARKNYAAENIEYINTDLESFIKLGREFDYVVSRHALEHIKDGLDVALAIPVSMRLIVNVPFNEDDKNPFHLLHWIDELSFANYKNREYFYESMTGETSLNRDQNSPPNSIVCVSSADRLVKVGEMLAFPLLAWTPEFLQKLGLGVLADNLPEREELVRVREARMVEREARMVEREARMVEREARMIERDEQVRVREMQVVAKLAIYDQLLLVRVVRRIRRLFK